MYVHILAAAVARPPVLDSCGHSGLRRGLGYGAAECERLCLVGIEVSEGCREVALKAGGLRVAFGVGQWAVKVCRSPVMPRSRTVAVHLPTSLPSAILVKCRATSEAAPYVPVAKSSVPAAPDNEPSMLSILPAASPVGSMTRVSRRTCWCMATVSSWSVSASMVTSCTEVRSQSGALTADVCPASRFRHYCGSGAAYRDVFGGVVRRKGVIAGIEEVIRRVGLSGLCAGISAHRHRPLRRDVHSITPVAPVGGDGDPACIRMGCVVQLVLHTGGSGQQQGCRQKGCLVYAVCIHRLVLLS